MESESSRDGSVVESEGQKSGKTKKHFLQKDESNHDVKLPATTPHSASSKLTKRTLFPTTPASYSDDDSCQSIGRRKRRKFTAEAREKQSTPGIHLSERQQVLLLKTFAAENSPKPSSPALSASSQGNYSASSGTDRLHRRNIRGETLLHIAAHRGEVKQILELIDQGLDVNALDNAEWTPLHEACNKGHAEAAKVLLEHGALVNAKGDDDITPLHDAAGSSSLELVKLLLEHGADPNAIDRTGRYPVDIATSSPVVEAIKSWPTYQPGEPKTEIDSSNPAREFSNAESPRLNSAANPLSPITRSMSPSTYDSALDHDTEQEKTTTADSLSASISTPTVKSKNEFNQRVPPLQTSSNSENATTAISVDVAEENPPPPLLTPQLPDEKQSQSTEKTESHVAARLQQNSPSPLPPPELESAVANLPQLDTLASSPPLVVITDAEDTSKKAKSSDLLLQVCTPVTGSEPPSEVTSSLEQPTLSAPDEAPKSANSQKQEPTVASYRARRKITSKEAPVGIGHDEKVKQGSHRRRLGSVGVISPGNKDSSSSASAESGLKVQPLRKRIMRNDDDKETVKEKRRAREKEKPVVEQECAQHMPDPYEFVEETSSTVELAVHHLVNSTPTSSPRSAHSPTKVGATPGGASPSISSTKTGSRRHRSRRPSSPSSMTPNEMKLPPLKIRINRPANAATESSRQSESESSASSVSAVKAEAEEPDELGRSTVESSIVPVKSEPDVTADDVKGEQCPTDKGSSVPPRKRKVRGAGSASPGLLSVVTNVGNGVSPVISPSSLPTQEQFANFLNMDKPRLPNYIKQWQLARNWVTERRRQQLAPAQLATVPRGVGDFLMIRKNYLLAADGGQQIMNSVNPNQEVQPVQPPTTLPIGSGSAGGAFASTLPPQQLPSPTLPPSLQALFRSQEETRHCLRIQHRVEQEKLVLSYEQEVLRAYVHRELTAAQAQPLSACAILMESHAACKAPPEALMCGQVSGGSSGASTNSVNNSGNDLSAQQRALRLNARHQRPRLDDLDEKFTRLADALLQRQRHEAAATRAVQAAEWAWRTEIIAQMAGDNSPNAESNSSSYQVNPNTVPLVAVPDSLPIPRLI